MNRISVDLDKQSVCSVDRIRDFLAGRLSSEHQLTLETHLEVCESCEQTLQQIRVLQLQNKQDEASKWAERYLKHKPDDENLPLVIDCLGLLKRS